METPGEVKVGTPGLPELNARKEAARGSPPPKARKTDVDVTPEVSEASTPGVEAQVAAGLSPRSAKYLATVSKASDAKLVNAQVVAASRREAAEEKAKSKAEEKKKKKREAFRNSEEYLKASTCDEF